MNKVHALLVDLGVTLKC